MSRVISITIFVVLALAYCQGEKPEVRFSPEMGKALVIKVNSCAKEVNGDVANIMQQIYTWDIKDEDKIKHFLSCFYRGDESGSIIDPIKVIERMGDFQKKDDVIKVLEDCGAKSIGSYNMDELFSFEGCFIRNTPVDFKL